MTTPRGRTADSSTSAPAAVDLESVSNAVLELRDALATLFNLPDLLGLSTSALAREIGVDRSTLQRLVQAVRAKDGAAEVLSILPGAKGMRRCLETWAEWAGEDARGDASREACATALDAADGLDRAIRLAGGTRPRVLDMLRATASDAPSGSADEVRPRMHRDTAELIGSSCDVAVKIFAYGESADQPDRIDRATMEAMYGYDARAEAPPLLLSLNTYFQKNSEAPEVSFEPKGWVAEHSSDPPMVVSARTTPTRDALVLVEPGDRPSVDRDLCVLAERHDYSVHPARLETPLQEVLGMVHYPSARLLQVVLLQRSLYRDSTAQWSEAKLWRPSLGALHGDRFLFCLPDAPSLRIVDRVPEGLRVDGFPRLADLADHVLRASGWNPEDFIALLIDVEFPIWRAGYSIGVEFGG